MYTEISFPSLGLTLNPPRNLEAGPLNIYFYGMIIAFGLVLAVVYACRRSKQFGLTEDDILDGVLCIVPFAIICARLYYCIFSWDAYAAEPIKLLYIWEGGLAIYGGVIGAVIGIVVFSFVKKVKLGAVLDIVALGFLIGQAIGRWGNFFNREAYGAVTDSFLRMGLMLTENRHSTASMIYYHPTFFYESMWNLVGFIALHFLSKKRQYDGQIALGYAAWYGLGRTMIEGLRTDSLYIFKEQFGEVLRVSQLLAAVSCLAATTVLVIMIFKKHDPQKLFVNRVAAKEALENEDTEQEETE